MIYQFYEKIPTKHKTQFHEKLALGQLIFVCDTTGDLKLGKNKNSLSTVLVIATIRVEPPAKNNSARHLKPNPGRGDKN